MTAALVKSKLNPHGIKQWSYICLPCKRNAQNGGDIKKAVLRAESAEPAQVDSVDITENTVEETNPPPVEGETASDTQQHGIDPQPSLAAAHDDEPIVTAVDAHSHISERRNPNKPLSHPDNFPDLCRAYL